MLHLLKLFWFVVKELLFDSKEEYDFRSKKFNHRKMTAAVMMMLSFLMNIWLLQRFYAASTDYMELKKEQAVCSAKVLDLTGNTARLDKQLEEVEDRIKKSSCKVAGLDKKASGAVIR